MKRPLIASEGGILPMIATPGAPTRADIKEVLVRYQSAGISQFLFFGRAGCEYEYLSERWMDMCADFIELADELGMKVWLYDDYNCPTTYVNGQLTAQGPEYQAKSILAYLDGEQFVYQQQTNPKAGDMLSDTAIDYFVSSTYEAYAARFSQYFGKTILGIFSDEPTQGHLPRKTSWDNRIVVPSYTGIDDDYQELTGRGLADDMRAYLLDNQKDSFWLAYWDLIGKRSRAYLDRLSNWCREHDLVLTGHLYDEHDSYDAVFKNGDPMHVLKGYSFPGMDEIFTETSVKTAEWITLGMVENAIRAVGAGGMAELLSLGPCDMPVARMRQMIWLTALFHIDHYLVAVAQLNAKGNSTRGSFYGPCNLVQPDFPLHALLAEDAKRAVALAHKENLYKVVVHFPQQLAARKAVNHRTLNVYDAFCELRHLLVELVAHQITWILVDEDTPADHAAPSILINENGYVFNGSDYSLDALLSELSQSVRREAVVTDAAGQACRHVFVRSYTDGTVAVVDLNQDEQERLYHLRIGQSVWPFLLNGSGIRVFEEAACDQADWQIIYDQANLLRCNFAMETKEYRFTCKDNLSACRILIRQHDAVPIIELDGSPVVADQPCTLLPQGFAELYRQTAMRQFGPGEHTIRLINDCDEYPYLPGVFLAGNMKLVNPDELSDKMPEFCYGSMMQHGLAQYVGKITLTCTIKVPTAPNSVLCLNPLAHHVAIYLDDVLIGDKSWAPYEWSMPAHYHGKNVVLKVVLASSFGPMFGNLEAFDRITMNYVQRQIPGKYSTLGLIDKPYFRIGG